MKVENPVRGELIGTKEAAKMMGIARATLSEWLQKGRCPVPFFRQVTGKYIFDTADIYAYMSAVKVEVAKR